MYCTRICLALVLAAMVAPAAVAAPIYQIDIDSTAVSGSDNTGPVSTTPGWTSLLATANGSGVVLDGINFNVGSIDGSRIRLLNGAPNPSSLTGDFIYDDGANQAVILFFGIAGSLAAGEWQVDAYIYDSLVGASLGEQIVGYRTNGVETIVSTTVIGDPVNPAISFTFTSDGTSAYDLFVREGSTFDRSRLNAVRLSYVPEPSTMALALLAGSGIAIRYLRRRKHRLVAA